MVRTMTYLLDVNVLSKIFFPVPVVESFACKYELFDMWVPQQSPWDQQGAFASMLLSGEQYLLLLTPTLI